METHGSEAVSLCSGYICVFFLRPVLAIVFMLSLVLIGWFVAWKTVLVHVPLIQEICGLRKKPVKPKPPTRQRLSKFYNSRYNRSAKEESSKELSSAISTAGGKTG